MLLRIQPGRSGMIDRTEAHALKAVLLHPEAKPYRNLRILRIDESVGDKELGIAREAVCNIGVVPAEIARIDQHGIAKTEIAHLLDLILDRSLLFRLETWPTLRVVEGELRVGRPNFQMG